MRNDDQLHASSNMLAQSVSEDSAELARTTPPCGTEAAPAFRQVAAGANPSKNIESHISGIEAAHHSSIKGVHFIRRAKSGKPTSWYVYAWRGGPLILKSQSSTKPVLGPNELDAIKKARAAPKEQEPKTLSWLINEWRSSPEWQRFADTTKHTWGSVLRLLEKKWGKVPLSIFYDDRMVPKIIKWRDERAATPRAADMGICVLRALLKFGRLRVGSTKNIAADIPQLYPGGDRADIVWTKDDIDRFVCAARDMGMPAVADAVRLAGATGLRRGDLVTLTAAHVAKFAIIKKARKKSKSKRRFAAIPRIPSLDSLLDELRKRPRQNGVTTILVDEDGNAWTGDKLTKAIAEVRDSIGIVHIDDETKVVRKKHLHDLRGTFATNLMIETDLTDYEIADIMAWSPEEVTTIRRIYVDPGAKAMAIGERIRRGFEQKRAL